MNIGCHLSVARGLAAMAENAVRIKAGTFQFFPRNPRGGRAKARDPADEAAFGGLLERHGLGPLLVHAPYTYSPSSADPAAREFTARAMRQDLARLKAWPGAMYVLHPGAHGGRGVEDGIARTAALLDEVLSDGGDAVVLLETMAGTGTQIGRSFGELARIIGKTSEPGRLGVCLDVCHVFAAGYDILEDLDGVLAELDATLGAGALRAVHVNDSRHPLGSRKDGHAGIGKGFIGLEAIGSVLAHPRLHGLPFVLETPNTLVGFAREIRLLRRLARRS